MKRMEKVSEKKLISIQHRNLNHLTNSNYSKTTY